MSSSGVVPPELAALLDTAIGHDPHNEALYQAAIRARHAFGDRDGIRALLHTLDVALADLDVALADLDVALADLDTEPDEATRELADRLARTIPASPPRGASPDDGRAAGEAP